MKEKTIERIRKFTEDRDWDQFHSPANLAKSIVIEAAELLECFQWSDMKEKKTGKGNNFPTNCREVQQMKDMEINEKIRYFRKQRGLSQELLAERTGINVNTIRKYEIGIRKPKVEQLKKIADGLEISVIEFLDIEIENEADLIAMLKKISPFFKWDGLLHVLVGEKFL